MKAHGRGLEPALITQHGAEIGQKYAARRAATPSYQFDWPRKNGRSLLEVVRDALLAMSEAHCAYCDGHHLDATGEAQIDHFQPKTDPRFYLLVCAWPNLYLTCMRCNKAKRDRWDPALLRPDEPGFSFERYFAYDFETGKLQPNGAASAEDRERASVTIELLDLNRRGACTSRQRTVRELRRMASDDERGDLAYRFLIPLCAT